MANKEPFSKRNRYASISKEITIWEDAPETLRYFVLDKARELEYAPSTLRVVICRALRKRPDPDNWSEYPNIWNEVQELMYGCEWFKVYDIIEALYASFARNDENSGTQDAEAFSDATNALFAEEGIGWQLVNGQIITRGNEVFEQVVNKATDSLQDSERPTAAKHLREALLDLSRRPHPDLAGAVYHSMGSLEALARDITDDPRATLGEILKRHPALLPKPLNASILQIWGYASNQARHVEEGREPTREEAELVVGLCAAISTYLSRRKYNSAD